MNHMTKFVGTMLHVNELPDDFDVEANRLLHNYLAALATLRNVQRAIHRQLWPDNYAPDDKDDKRTKWQVEVWEPRVAATFGDDPIRFLVDLCNFSVHYPIPPVTLTTMWHGSGGQPMQWENVVALDRDELLKWSGWSGASRRYIETHDGDIEFIAVVAAYSTKVRTFYRWVWELVEDEVRLDLSEYLGKSNEYRMWRHVEGTWGHYGPDGRSVQRPRLAEARLAHAALGASGWVFRPDENGEWVVGESDWPPLLVGPDGPPLGGTTRTIQSLARGASASASCSSQASDP
jgi:hypothetical protein